jgi:spore coat polysaccharide biosynthesis protein SpsF
MKTVAIIQARVSSTRLPGKVLSDVHGKPMLLRMIERVRRCQLIDEFIVATSVSPEDGPVADLCRAHSVPCFRGSLNDVLDRFYRAAEAFLADVVVRLTADCPLVDPGVVDEACRVFRESKDKFDYVSNALKPTFPDGLDVSVISMRALKEAYQEATLPSEREHVVPWIWKMSDWKGGNRYHAYNLECAKDLAHLRWTVDEASDLELIRAIYGHFLSSKKEDFRMDDILEFLAERRDLQKVNQHLVRDAGYLKSLEKDKEQSK